MSLRKFIRRGIGLLGFLWFVSVYAYPIPDSIAVRLQGFVSALEQFGKALPQEKVYLHLICQLLSQGDQIWFQCYVVTSEFNRPTAWSKTLYVELLNPGGEIVSRQILPIRNGRCQGNFTLTHLPFYSGFYEVRAYTKYMLNFERQQSSHVFSRCSTNRIQKAIIPKKNLLTSGKVSAEKGKDQERKETESPLLS